MAATAIGIALQVIPPAGAFLKEVLPLIGDGKKKLKLATTLAEQHEAQLRALKQFAEQMLTPGAEITEEKRVVVLFLLDQAIANADALGDFTRGQDDPSQ